MACCPHRFDYVLQRSVVAPVGVDTHTAWRLSSVKQFALTHRVRRLERGVAPSGPLLVSSTGDAG
jgi:hypothetical protein